MEKRTCLNCQNMRICDLYQQIANGVKTTGGNLQDFRIVLKVVGEQCGHFEEFGEGD